MPSIATTITAQSSALKPRSATAAATINRPVQVLDEHTAPEKLHDIRTIILDCDGVLWRGSEIIRNAPEVRQLGPYHSESASNRTVVGFAVTLL